MENITTAEVMYKLDIFQSRFGKIDQFGWWDLEIISADAGTQFTLTEFNEECQTCGVRLTLAAPEHQDMNRQVEVTWRTLRTVAHTLMVHARVPEVYFHFTLMYTTDHIFPVAPMKDLINEDGDRTTPHKLATGTKPSVSHLRVLFCPRVVRKSTAHVDTKTLNMRHQAQKGFRGIFIGIPEHQKGYLVYVPSTRKVISSYDVVFDKKKSSALSYTSRPYSEATVMRPAVTFTLYATSMKEQTGDVITFKQFQEGNILTETCNDTESGEESDNESIMMSKQDMENLDSSDESDHDLISTDTLQDMRDGSQTHHMVRLRKNKLAISLRSHSFRRGTYELKLITIQKSATNPIANQL